MSEKRIINVALWACLNSEASEDGKAMPAAVEEAVRRAITGFACDAAEALERAGNKEASDLIDAMLCEWVGDEWVMVCDEDS